MTKKNLNDLIDKIDPDKKEIAQKLIDEIIFLQDTLSDLKSAVKVFGVVDENGKTTPALNSYNQTIKSYSMCLKQLEILLRRYEIKDTDTDDLQAFLEAG
jgi:hypothetical protein